MSWMGKRGLGGESPHGRRRRTRAGGPGATSTTSPPRPVRPCLLQARRLPRHRLGRPRANHAQSLQWRFKCDPLEQEKADGVLEENFTRKVKQMLHEEKAAAIKRLMKKGQLPAQLTEVDENGNHWPTKEALISAKKVDFGTDVGWRLLCEHWSGAEFRGLSLRNKRNRLANGDTVFHCSGARNAVATRQFLGKTLEFPVLGFTRTICIEGPTKRRFAVKELPIVGLAKSCDLAHFNHHDNYLHKTLVYIIFLFEKEDFDKAMKHAHGENWEEEHPDLDGQIVYEAEGRMPHGRLGIANELFSKAEKAKFKSKRVMASQPVRSAREDRLERENKHLKRENKRLRGIEIVVQGMGSRTGGSTSHGDDDEDDYYGSEGDDDYGKDGLYGDEPYYGGEGYNDYEDEEYNEYGNDNDDWP
ncbi:uncharacterized protein LOC125548345 isoform X2 [Triticum urartu]|uniref:uncharacterized protein LOC125548345 isoform X2 n=1 Tax=Triticum urartu TaxID=4572 RepID=UPI002043083D|nr:uncharacterized protein LOC125548345 isoform X2 [Triticum urartu]